MPDQISQDKTPLQTKNNIEIKIICDCKEFRLWQQNHCNIVIAAKSYGIYVYAEPKSET